MTLYIYRCRIIEVIMNGICLIEFCRTGTAMEKQWLN